MQGEFPEGVAALLARDMRGGVAGGENKTGKWCSESESEMSMRLTAADLVHVECVGAFERGRGGDQQGDRGGRDVPFIENESETP